MKRPAWKRLCCLICCLLLLPGILCLPARGEEADDTEQTIAERAAEVQKTIRTMKVGQYGMIPVYGRDVADGTYPIEVETNSPFFKIVAAELTVRDGQMTAKITVSSLSYLYVFPGTAQEAGNAPESAWIDFRKAGERAEFTIPVEALDSGMELAAYSKRRKRWYDREILFNASSLPEGALSITLPDYELIEAAIRAYKTDAVEAKQEEQAAEPPEAVSLPRSDGEYSIEVNMTGGSGRASISSPTLLIIRDGKAYARLIWSSTYYDYMIMEDYYYFNQTVDGGNSVFEIPITALDESIPIIADTTAMGDPVEIAYTLTFYSESIGDKGDIPQEGAKKVLAIAAVIILVGGVLNWFVKKKRK